MLAAASGWFGKDGKTELQVSIQGQQIGPLAMGMFGISTVSGIVMQGRCAMVHAPQTDTDGSVRVTVDAYAMVYKPGANGLVDWTKGIPAQVLCVITTRADGSASVGARAVNYYTGEVLYSGDADKNGLIDEVPLIRGGASIY
jgi:hypothetical protein